MHGCGEGGSGILKGIINTGGVNLRTSVGKLMVGSCVS